MSASAMSRRSFLPLPQQPAPPASPAAAQSAQVRQDGRSASTRSRRPRLPGGAAAQRRSGRTVQVVLAHRMGEVNLSGKAATAMTYGG
jgi:hypothetical protein